MMEQNERLRTVVTTDGEVDDMNSWIRCLLYSNEYDLEGLVLTSSVYHYAGDPSKGVEPYRWTGEQWVSEFVQLYKEVYPNLCIHAQGYPNPDELLKKIKIGNIANVGEMDYQTEGATYLESLFMDDDERTLYVQTWGGTNTTARALKNIEEKYKDTPEWKEIYQKVSQKVAIYIILNQDASYDDYIAKHWPDLLIINDVFNFWQFAYAWKMHAPELNTRLEAKWMKENIKFNHGPLLEKYALIGDGNYLEGELYDEQRGIDAYLEKHPEYQRYDFISEGDSPSFFYLFDFGLRSIENPSFGGWGGRFCLNQQHRYVNDALDYNPYTKRYEAEYTLERWFDDIQDDFKGRADWCVATQYDQVAHYPNIILGQPEDIYAEAGQEVILSVKATDSNQLPLTYRWWRYFEADSYNINNDHPVESSEMAGMVFGKYQLGEPDERVVIKNNDQDRCSFIVPEDSVGTILHIILEVSNGTFKRYARTIVHVI